METLWKSLSVEMEEKYRYFLVEKGIITIAMKVITIFTLSIQKSQPLQYLFIKSETFHLIIHIDVSKNNWMGGKRCRHWPDAAISGI